MNPRWHHREGPLPGAAKHILRTGSFRGEVAAAEDYTGIGFCGVDAKQRFTLPVEFRHRVRAGSEGNLLYLHLSDDRPYMQGFGKDYLDEVKAEILEKGRSAREHGNSFDRLEEGRLNFADLEKVTFDDAGRFALDDIVKDVMGISDCLFFVGNGWAFEVWAPDAFLASDIGSRMGKIRCKGLYDQWLANPKNPSRAGA